MLAHIKRWLASPVFPDEAKTYSARVLHIILLTLLAATVPGSIAATLQEGGPFTPTLVVVLFAAAAILGMLGLVRYGHTRLPSYLISLLALGLFTFTTFSGNGIHDTTAFGYVMVIALAGLLLGKNAPIIFGVLSGLALAAVTAAEVNGLIETPFGSVTGYEDMLIIVAILGIATMLFRVAIANLTDSLDRARRSETDLRMLNEELEQRVNARTRELDKAREEAEAARTTAEEANRVKSQFLANMSHELRTPLNAILNFTAFVADGVMGPVNDEQRDALQQSINSGKHLLTLINDVLDITKIESGMMDLFIQEVDLNEALSTTVSIGSGLVKDKPIELVAEIEPNLPTTFGDKRRIRQIFLNLVSNAVKFTPKGRVTLTAHRSTDKVVFSVLDTGIGIAPENQAAIFESFKQVKQDLPDVVGTGLGLALTKYFVESHGGTIGLQSEVGKGTSFVVILPILTEAEANALSKEVPQPEPVAE